MGRVLGVALFYALLVDLASAQDAQRPVRVGILSPSVASLPFIRQNTLPELARRGFVVGGNLQIEERVGSLDSIDALARDLVSTKPHVVIAVSDFAIRAVYDADPSVPIVMSFIGDDPVANGYAASLSRPGGRVTGTMMLSHEMDVKRLELLHEVLPSAKRIAVLRYPPPRHNTTFPKVSAAASRIGLTLNGFVVGSSSDYPTAIENARQWGADALMVLSSPDFARDAAIIAKIATEAGLPTTCEWDYMAREGCLVGYGASMAELRRRTGVHVAQILQGIPAGDIPIEGPTSFTLALNRRTAQALGVDFQPGILARADEVIE